MNIGLKRSDYEHWWSTERERLKEVLQLLQYFVYSRYIAKGC